MNFFEVQDQARRSTRRLVFLYLLATALIVAGVTLIVAVATFNLNLSGEYTTFWSHLNSQAPTLIGTAIVVTLLIAGATLV